MDRRIVTGCVPPGSCRSCCSSRRAAELTAAELAAELEVSERTIHRDVEALSASGVPIYAERGVARRLPAGRRVPDAADRDDRATRPRRCSSRDCPGRPLSSASGTVVAAAQLKVLASLPPEFRARASRLVERFHLDAGEWFRASQPVPHLAALSEAVWNATRITIEYDRGEGATRRVLEPLGLVLKAGIWYVVAAVDGQVRTYRVSRVVRAEPGEERFERPDGLRPRLLLGRISRPPTNAMSPRVAGRRPSPTRTASTACAMPSAARSINAAEHARRARSRRLAPAPTPAGLAG